VSFDANMNATKCGDTFTATIHSLSEASALYRVGFRLGDNVLCEKNLDTSILHVKAPKDYEGYPWLAVKGVTSPEVETLLFCRYLDNKKGFNL
jgi:hypothetical protein